jgi:hypothetical protein
MVGVTQKFALFAAEIVFVEYPVGRFRETMQQFRLQSRIDQKLEDAGLRHLLDGNVRALMLLPREVRNAVVEQAAQAFEELDA